MSFEVADDEPTPFDRFSNLEDRERIAAALLQLDTLHREVLVLRFHEELSAGRDCQGDARSAFYCEIKTLPRTGRDQAQTGAHPCCAAGGGVTRRRFGRTIDAARLASVRAGVGAIAICFLRWPEIQAEAGTA
jgi:hypothetical protein